MIKSMTAFASADLSSEICSVAIEIRGYNSRYLDVAVKIPPPYTAIEDKLRHVIAEQITRGRIELRVTIQDAEESPETFKINETMAGSYFDALTRLRKTLNWDVEIPFEIVAKKNGVIESEQLDVNTDKIWDAVSPCLLRALKGFESMKAAEGIAITADLNEKLAFIQDCICRIENQACDMPALYQEKLKERIKALTNGLVDIDPGRIAQEAAFLADKSDICEEIVRAKSHISQFRQLMEADSPSGRALNFLLQEFNREFNTMGSKAGNTTISHLVVSAKTELEKIREQIQNVE